MSPTIPCQGSLREREYVDHAIDPIYSLKLFQSAALGSGELQRQIREGDIISFPLLLCVLLKETSADEMEKQIASWNDDGRGFQVHDRKAFEHHIMPRFFQSRKYATFQRQLKWYQFSRIKDGKKAGSFIHPFFLRGRPDLLNQVERLSQRDPPPGDFKIDSLDHLSSCHELTYEQILELCSPSVVPQLKELLRKSPPSSPNYPPPKRRAVSPSASVSVSDTARVVSDAMVLSPSRSARPRAVPVSPMQSANIPDGLLDDFRMFPFEASVAEKGQLVHDGNRGQVFLVPARPYSARTTGV